MLVPTNRQNTCNRGLVKTDLRKPAIRMLRANMSTRAVSKISKSYAYDHLLDWSCRCQTEGIQDNICIFIAITLDETSILIAVYFSIQNIYQSCDLGRILRQSNVDVCQKLFLLTDVCVTLVAYRHDIKRGRSASWLFQDPCRYDWILNIKKSSSVRCLIIIDIWMKI